MSQSYLERRTGTFSFVSDIKRRQDGKNYKFYYTKMIQTHKNSSTVLKVLFCNLYFHMLFQEAKVKSLISPIFFLARVLKKTTVAASKFILCTPGIAEVFSYVLQTLVQHQKQMQNFTLKTNFTLKVVQHKNKVSSQN